MPSRPRHRQRLCQSIACCESRSAARTSWMRWWIWPVRGEDTPQADHPPLHSAGWSVGQSIRLRRSAFPTHARRLARSANALAVLDYGMSWAAVAKILSRKKPWGERRGLASSPRHSETPSALSSTTMSSGHRSDTVSECPPESRTALGARILSTRSVNIPYALIQRRIGEH